MIRRTIFFKPWWSERRKKKIYQSYRCSLSPAEAQIIDNVMVFALSFIDFSQEFSWAWSFLTFDFFKESY